MEYYAKQRPGPGDHRDVLGAYAQTVARPGVGAAINKSTPKSALEWVEHYARQKPGPGQHDVPRFPTRLPTQKATDGNGGASTWSLPRLNPNAPR